MEPRYTVFIQYFNPQNGTQFYEKVMVDADSAEKAAIKAVGVWDKTVLSAEVIESADSLQFRINPPNPTAEIIPKLKPVGD